MNAAINILVGAAAVLGAVGFLWGVAYLILRYGLKRPGRFGAEDFADVLLPLLVVVGGLTVAVVVFFFVGAAITGVHP